MPSRRAPRDPFQAGVTAILGLVAGAALLFALVGLAISLWYTVSSRQGEFAVARALGLGRRQLLGWLAIESAFLIVVGVVGGILVGLVLAWVVMPSITLTLEGQAPVPPPVAAIAWDLAVVLARARHPGLPAQRPGRPACDRQRPCRRHACASPRPIDERAGGPTSRGCTLARLDLRADRAGSLSLGHPAARHDDPRDGSADRLR